MLVATKDEIQEAVNTKLWIKHSFLAAVSARVGVEFVESDVPACAYTDGKGIFVNWKYINENEKYHDMSVDNLIFVICHEVGHLLNLTVDRRGGREPRFWNFATDYSINSDLINNCDGHNKPKPIGEMYFSDKLITPENPKGQAWLYDEKYRNMTCEQIYESLMDEFKKDHGGKTPEQVEQEMQGAIEKWLEQHAKGQKQLDEHATQEGMDETDKGRIKAQVQAVQKQLGGQEAGKTDSFLERAFDYLFQEPPFDWRGFLSNYLKAFIKSDFTWKRPSRRSWGGGYILPGTNTDQHINLGIAIDTSGSVGDKEVREFLAHIAKIMHSFKSFNVDVWCFSTQVHEDTLKSYNKSNQDQIVDYKLNSFGGTEIASNFEWIKENKKKYDVFICMTDGYDNINNLEFDFCPVIWGITGNDDFTNPEGVKRAKTMRLEF